MSMATYQADGVSPSAGDLRAPAPFLAEVIAGMQVLMVGGAAIALLAAAHDDTRKVQPPAPAYRSPLAAPITLSPPLAEAPADSRQVLQDLLTKAGLRPHFDVHRLSWNQARRINTLMPAADLPVDAAKPFVLPVASRDGAQALHCLTQAAYFEAGAAGPDAEAGVVQVVLNRVRHPDFPKSVCGVVYQGSARQTGCQFTFTCDGALKRGLDAAAWEQARKVAMRALNGYVVPAVGSATYYHADYVFPAWAPALVKLATIGPHIFYRMSGAEGAAAALTGRYAGGELKISRAVLKAADAFTQKGRAEADLKLASLGKAQRIKPPEEGRAHLQFASAKPPADNEDARLNTAQTAAPVPVLAPAPVVAAAPAPAPVAALATTPTG
jgi:spore germination cell wall hydrolase CwlJ-like protein